MTRLGVGIVAAGPATQAIHLPTLARLRDHFRVSAVMDVDHERAASVAARAGATPAATLEEVLENPAVDVVAVCSPDPFHAEQIAMTCAARKRGILCEKPLGNSIIEAEQIVNAVSDVGIPLVVGTMHAYDPVWLNFWGSTGRDVQAPHYIRSTLTLPFNTMLEDYASEIAGRPPHDGRTNAAEMEGEDLRPPQAQARGLVLGLWIHDLPWIRAMAPQVPRVDAVRLLRPTGGIVALRAGDVRIQLLAYMRGVWESDWRLDAWGEDWRLRIEVPPSYVHTGATTITFRDRAGERVFRGTSLDGYEAEWLELHRLVTSGGEPRYPLSALHEDLRYAIAIADGAVEHLHGGGAS